MWDFILVGFLSFMLAFMFFAGDNAKQTIGMQVGAWSIFVLAAFLGYMAGQS